MRDRLLTYAIVISVVAHMCVAVVVGRTSAARLASAPPRLAPRYINVDLIDLPAKQAPKASEMPKVSLPDAPPPPPPPLTSSDTPPGHQSYTSSAPPSAGPSARAASVQPAGDPGGALNTGTPSTGGDVPMGAGGGRTPVGWVPSPEDGQGQGSGTGAGVGTPDVPKHADPGEGMRPAPAPPQPAMVNVRVCEDSGLLPSPNCKQNSAKSFIEGRQPTRTCDKCQPEHKNRLADRAAPELIRDSRPAIPSSVEEGLSVRVEIQYTITADGDVTDVQVTKSSGNKAIDRAVARSASDLKYKPAVQDGVPRSVKKTRSYTVNT